MPHQPPGPSLPDGSDPRPPPPREEPMAIDPTELAEELRWPLGITCAGAVDCPSGALNQTLAQLETARGTYHLVVTASHYTRSRSLWIAWLPREAMLLTLIDEQPEGMVDQALAVIAQHLAAGQPS